MNTLSFVAATVLLLPKVEQTAASPLESAMKRYTTATLDIILCYCFPHSGKSPEPDLHNPLINKICTETPCKIMARL